MNEEEMQKKLVKMKMEELSHDGGQINEKGECLHQKDLFVLLVNMRNVRQISKRCRESKSLMDVVSHHAEGSLLVLCLFQRKKIHQEILMEGEDTE